MILIDQYTQKTKDVALLLNKLRWVWIRTRFKLSLNFGARISTSDWVFWVSQELIQKVKTPTVTQCFSCFTWFIHAGKTFSSHSSTAYKNRLTHSSLTNIIQLITNNTTCCRMQEQQLVGCLITVQNGKDYAAKYFVMRGTKYLPALCVLFCTDIKHSTC